MNKNDGHKFIKTMLGNYSINTRIKTQYQWHVAYEAVRQYTELVWLKHEVIMSYPGKACIKKVLISNCLQELMELHQVSWHLYLFSLVQALYYIELDCDYVLCNFPHMYDFFVLVLQFTFYKITKFVENYF